MRNSNELWSEILWFPQSEKFNIKINSTAKKKKRKLFLCHLRKTFIIFIAPRWELDRPVSPASYIFHLLYGSLKTGEVGKSVVKSLSLSLSRVVCLFSTCLLLVAVKHLILSQLFSYSSSSTAFMWKLLLIKQKRWKNRQEKLSTRPTFCFPFNPSSKVVVCSMESSFIMFEDGSFVCLRCPRLQTLEHEHQEGEKWQSLIDFVKMSSEVFRCYRGEWERSLDDNENFHFHSALNSFRES